jgi:hypothetical protein
LIPKNDIAPGEQHIGDLHTHQQKDGTGTPTSIDDLLELKRNAKDGYMEIVEAGDKRYALVVTDAKKARDFLDYRNASNLEDVFNAQYENPKNGNENQRTVAGIMAVIGDCSKSGLSFYVTTDKEKVTFTRVEPIKPPDKK